jgi:hypothetical protein
MKVEIWDSEIEDCITGVVDDDPDKEFLVGEGAILVRTIEGVDWNDCMRQHHELMGWEPYIPFEDVE